ncbi:DoxX family protein [Mucilaginibacter terrenus]|uniref:DoxX family protein n=1 Tax=Mucilaginibacter terrenus TaxID=2482727 RepID=A0A3E2NR45_9SPHI|nr:DoxX family protein [Mucilaginibacter terrenus]RFZ83462.1 DoxX family protein [Mucilaginibacter terrenus]
MQISTVLDKLHAQATHNRWMRYFATFNRVALAWGFLLSGFIKIMGERFTSLSNNHPMGAYLEALYHTGFYYTFIGVAQVTAAILILIPRTAVLGVLLYLPIILNICVLSLSVRFEGSLLTSPLMVISCLFLLCWYYDRIKYILPFNTPPSTRATSPSEYSNSFPKAFFAGVFATVAMVVFALTHVFSIMPRNTLSDCNLQCKDSANPGACKIFCECIHQKGQPLNNCLENYNKVVKGSAR